MCYIYKFDSFSLQNYSSALASDVAEAVAQVTSEPENLTAADVSVSVLIVSQLTDEAITNSEVGITCSYITSMNYLGITYHHR